MIVASIPTPVLREVINGNLSAKVRSDTSVRDLLRDILGEDPDKPSVYYQQFVDTDGNSPTPNELCTILNHIETYIKGTDHIQARLIDSFKGPGVLLPQSQGGYRKYLWTKCSG
jgi:hypothetical protein